jgi:hypothetical protein
MRLVLTTFFERTFLTPLMNDNHVTLLSFDPPCNIMLSYTT